MFVISSVVFVGAVDGAMHRCPPLPSPPAEQAGEQHSANRFEQQCSCMTTPIL